MNCIRVWAIVLGLLAAGGAQAASCNLNKPFNINVTQDELQADEAECARRAMTQSKDLFRAAVVAQDQGDRAGMCKAMHDSLFVLEPYKKGDWREVHESVADGVDNNYSVISEEFVKTTCPEKITLYERRAAGGSAWAMTNLGIVYEEGKEVPLDMAKSIEWYKKAVELDYIDAMTNLAVVYSKGTNGVPVDQAAAASLYLKAANLGDNDSQYYIGYRYQNAMGVPQDYAEAARWFRICAKNDDKDCKNKLKEMYSSGQAKKPLFGP